MKFQRITKTIASQIKVVAILVVTITLIEVINLISDRSLNQFGLIPRHSNGLMGVLSAPFLHASFAHFSANIWPIFVFGFLLVQHGIARFWLVTFIIIAVSGSLVWLFGRIATHVGASGLIYGYLGYLLVAGWMSRKVELFAISLFVGAVYGSLVWGVLPVGASVSWEFHLFGFVSGVMCALSLDKFRQ